MPAVTNYLAKDYEAGYQNWACAQGSNGEMYFGNSQGLQFHLRMQDMRCCGADTVFRLLVHRNSRNQFAYPDLPVSYTHLDVYTRQLLDWNSI